MSIEKEKRVRKKSRKLSERDLLEEEPPKKKKKGQPHSSDGGDSPEALSKMLVVSLNTSVLNSTVVDRLHDKHSSSSSSPTSCKNDSSGARNGGGSCVSELGIPSRRELKTNFKDKKFTFSFLGPSKKKTWKNFKQIITAERSLKWGPNDPTYTSIDAPPPLKPPKKYSDLSGLLAKYTDPLTGLYYNSSEEFELIRTLPTDIVQGYLSLRGKIPVT